MKRTEAIVIAVAVLWLLGALASFWRASDASLFIGLLLVGVALIGLAALIVRKVMRR